ncbi:fumarylacetoacetate hydrolase family protein [Pseudoalteromonas ardens]|uniref:5-carboxymethyl-2-hydroxymuconate delta-isomerase n=1 Tax=Pseudoalteromonas rubra TaxID=43658 RepID=A0A0L0EVN1_9GAMM|nr:fumarylacetoacetate hydrolase family protein [Pseudoalteromonas sp. R96]KNC68512.1 5-carboxymethyl-2-hydroxymuconate delta-isomerase [Pseudoalteromonas rubra]MDK1314312.1 fumarylacetoacetate hydrolase family protein [Pseudoalteromonas sp. R96]
MYQHLWESGDAVALEVGKAVCVGRNYVAHAKELNNPIPDSPLLFIKPASAFCHFQSPLVLNTTLGEHHYEAELVLLVGETIDNHTREPLQHICGIATGLDLTLRELQSKLKQQGHPWECAKAFDNSCSLTPFRAVNGLDENNVLHYRFWQNDALKQHGDSSLMIFSLSSLLTEISRYFTLNPGDIVMTGTPQGVGALNEGDTLALQLQDAPRYSATISVRR